VKGKQSKRAVATNYPLRDSQSFFQNVWDIVCLVPTGRVTTYGAIGKYLGSGLTARMVGWAMNACHHHADKVPAHRVVNRNGMLSGKMHFETPEQMQDMLEKEGTRVMHDKVVEFTSKFWDPAKELI
jgi:methylated-DNA-protein-cysteine methyltransferase-like protein